MRSLLASPWQHVRACGLCVWACARVCVHAQWKKCREVLTGLPDDVLLLGLDKLDDSKLPDKDTITLWRTSISQKVRV